MSVDIRERLPSVRSVASTLAVMVLVAALLPFVVFAVPQVVGADHGFVILSGSMEPTASPGDVVIVDASAGIAVGDIITFDDGNTAPTTHRVVAIEDGQYVTQGDANQNPDAQPVAPSDVLGRVTVPIPFVGHVILWVNTPTGYVTLVVAPLVLLVVNELFAWTRRDDSGDGDDDTANVTEDDTAATSPSNTTADSDDSRTTVTVSVADLKLTTLAMVGLVGYAAWNVYREVNAVAAPDPVSVAALTGGLLGLGFATWVTVTAWLAAANAATERPVPAPQSRPDGGTEGKQ